MFNTQHIQQYILPIQITFMRIKLPSPSTKLNVMDFKISCQFADMTPKNVEKRLRHHMIFTKQTSTLLNNLTVNFNKIHFIFTSL